MSQHSEWELLDNSEKQSQQISRPSHTYWQDAWRMLRKNVLAMIGLVTIILITLTAVLVPMFSEVSYSDQKPGFGNIPPKFPITKLWDGQYVYVHNEYKLIEVSEKGELLAAPDTIEEDMAFSTKTYEIGGKEVVLDYSYAKKAKKNGGVKYKIFVEGKEIDTTPVKTVRNRTNLLGTDRLGRDVWIRILYGARISLTVGLVASLVNLFIGVIYGGIAGYEGGRVDNIMMRIVDIINSVPSLLVVILLMVVYKPGLTTIIVTIGLIYWVGMARLVRGQVLSLKEQEFVLAARTIGVSKFKIIMRHLIPNAMGPIIVSLTMSIPSAIFTESFLSFIGLGVSAPEASWGTLANDALGGIRSYPYQLIAPAVAIAITMFAFNFLGDGLRDALDPRLRK
ncbi:ABC transporter permease [Cellulosilyticum lentocellum]|uniref:ABC-type transporter, integral membrane subunit n=1 Tax=Cellulosilyticum lentocellum (strain ATCC 49066 / DSM 5427 / NCIMB 11756 / RHM5) TaxID=642492 RepID=F2JJ15_CELLD|nr:ABC transporter permease [Cellulosilyticum lentocellum]ADZ83174.1 ABC-type transporter, integral membrane subunit [Cellulosilyticum lentocellum DSM 5427]